MRSALSISLLAALLAACSSPSSGHASLDDGAAGAAGGSTATTPGVTVTVAGDQGTLEGSLVVPEAAGPVPIALILSGSGPQDRDGNTPGSPGRTDAYRLLAEGLRAHGIASLRFDDPGVGKSASALPTKEADITYSMEVSAAGKWIPFLNADPRFSRLVLMGHSQGALTATLLAEMHPVAAVVSLEGAGRTIDAVLHEQLAPQLTSDQLATLDAALAQLKTGALLGLQSPPLDQLLRPSVQPYLASWMKYDPSAELLKVTVPAMIVQGRTDVQVSVTDAMLLAGAKPDAKLLLVDDLCHPLKQASTQSAASQTAQYSDPSLPLHPALVPALVAFVTSLP